MSHAFVAAVAKSVQSYLTLFNPMDSSPPGSPIPGIFQARTLEWVATSFSNAWKRKVKSLSRVQLLATPWTAPPPQAPQSMGFSRQEYWSGLPGPSPMSHAFKATQNGWVMVKSSEKTWSTGGGSDKPLQYSCLENPMNSLKRSLSQPPVIEYCYWT